MFSKKFTQLEEYHKNKQVINLESIHSDTIIKFNYYYKQLNSIVREIDDEWLNESFLILRNYFNNLRSSIKPFEDLVTEDTYFDINILFERIAQYREDEKVDKVLNSFGTLIGKIKSGFYENKLPKKIQEIIEENEKIAIISYYWTPKIVSPFGENTELIRIKKYLTTEDYYDKAILIGSPSYYYASYELVNSIQNANQIYYISYDIYSSSLLQKSVVDENTNKFSRLFTGFEIQDNTKKHNISEIESKEYFHSLEKSPIHNWVTNLVNHNTDKRSTVPSYAFELESERVIMYPENGSLYVINNENMKVKKVKSVDVNEAQWIVIKSSSERDYLDQKAAEIIGDTYYDIFEEVICYKELLLEKLQEFGSLEALKTDLKLSKIFATSQLLRNWVFGDTIAPKDYARILNYLGFGNKDIKTLVSKASRIVSARVTAGRNMMKDINKLFDEFGIEKIIKELDSNNYFEFEVPNTGQFVVEIIRQQISKKIDVEFKDLYKLHDVRFEKKMAFDNVKKLYIK